MTVISPTEVFYNHTSEDDLRYWGHDVPATTMLALLERATEYDDMLGFLDSLSHQAGSELHYAGFILSRLPAKALFDSYGEGVLAWAAANASYLDQKETLEDGLAELAGYDKGLFEKARLWAWQKHCSSKGREVLSQYAVMEAFTNGGLDQLDVPSILHESAAPGVRLSEKRIKDYALLPLKTVESYARIDDYVEGWHGEVTPQLAYKMWLDTPTGFALTYKGKPNAMVGAACLNQRELMVYQLQGVQTYALDPDKKHTAEWIIGTVSSRGLAPLDWQKVMIEAATQIARNLGMEKIGIQSARNNIWTKPRNGEAEPHLSLDAATKAYDDQAIRFGFTRGKDGNWHKPLHSSSE